MYLIKINKEIYEKAHLRSDFRKKNISLSGAWTHKSIISSDREIFRSFFGSSENFNKSFPN